MNSDFERAAGCFQSKIVIDNLSLFECLKVSIDGSEELR